MPAPIIRPAMLAADVERESGKKVEQPDEHVDLHQGYQWIDEHHACVQRDGEQVQQREDEGEEERHQWARGRHLQLGVSSVDVGAHLGDATEEEQRDAMDLDAVSLRDDTV